MNEIKVVYNAPGKEFIGYDVNSVADQVRISDAEVDARDELEQRIDFERAQDEAELAYDADDSPRGPFQRQEFGGFTPRGTQLIRERIAHELALEKLGLE